MKQLRPDAHYMVRARAGSRILGRLAGAGLMDLVVNFRPANDAVRAAGRTWEDLDLRQSETLGIRDYRDLTLDDAVRDERHELASRGRDAMKVPPYTLIFPNGIDEYVKASQSDQEPTYQRLMDRTRANLPTDDKVLREILPKIDDGLSQWKAAQAEAGKGDTAVADARIALESAVAGWDKARNDLYGELIKKVGKPKAERLVEV